MSEHDDRMTAEQRERLDAWLAAIEQVSPLTKISADPLLNDARRVHVIRARGGDAGMARELLRVIVANQEAMNRESYRRGERAGRASMMGWVLLTLLLSLVSLILDYLT